MYHLELVRSGDGRIYDLGTFASLAECWTKVQELDRRYEKWEEADFEPMPSDDDPLSAFEGCDITATNRNGDAFMLVGDGEWEPA